MKLAAAFRRRTLRNASGKKHGDESVNNSLHKSDRSLIDIIQSNKELNLPLL